MPPHVPADTTKSISDGGLLLEVEDARICKASNAATAAASEPIAAQPWTASFLGIARYTSRGGVHAPKARFANKSRKMGSCCSSTSSAWMEWSWRRSSSTGVVASTSSFFIFSTFCRCRPSSGIATRNRMRIFFFSIEERWTEWCRRVGGDVPTRRRRVLHHVLPGTRRRFLPWTRRDNWEAKRAIEDQCTRPAPAISVFFVALPINK
mmetsp:Transcript_19158/g.47893  ORF Transcript_19158/g.47893 Transcript_19158/m.47893 type:complete len:208 (+) Transcript_19158:404-1027(+)